MFSRQFSEIKASAEVEAYKNDLSEVDETLQKIPLWRPGAALSSQCRAAVEMIESLGRRMERKLVISLIGPSGSGKSTLINALSGEDHVSEAGIRRPTTRNIIAVVRQEVDAVEIVEQVGAGNLAICTAPDASVLDHMVLVDTPDTDSTEQDAHIPLIKKVIGLSDILICVFDGENPKRKDHVDFISPLVRLFHGMSLVVVLNKCDRQSETELKEHIMPEFAGYLAESWERSVKQLFCISARRHLNQPGWDAGAEPRHQFDQFEELSVLINDTFGKAGFSTSQRLQNARQIRNHMMEEVRNELLPLKHDLEAGIRLMRTSEVDAMTSAVDALKSDPARQLLGINVQFYQKLAQRWVGPVGWLIAVWARILVFGTGFAAMFRMGNPLRMLYGAFSAFKQYKASTEAVKSVKGGEQTSTAIIRYRLSIMQLWPDIAEKLVRAGFSESIRQLDSMTESGNNTISDDLVGMWAETLDRTLDAAADRLSNFPMQILFNLPPVGMLAYVGWLTTTRFFAGTILSSDFFLHAFLTIGIVLFLTFFIFQGVARLIANGRKIYRRVFDSLKNQLKDYRTVSRSPLGDQAENLMRLMDRR